MSDQRRYKRNIIEHDSVILAPPDMTLLVIVGFLLVIGLMAIFSASSEKCNMMGLDPLSFVWKQIFCIVLGYFGMMYLAKTDYKKLAPFAVPFAWGVVILLAFAAFTNMGVNTNEARRWIAIGPIQFQPSEFAKPAFALVLANAFKNNFIIFDQSKMRYYLPLIITLFLIFEQPNLSMIMLLMATSLVMYLCAGGNWKNILLMCAGGATFLAFKLRDYQMSRITTWLHPENDPQGAGYNILQSLYAICAGGFWGMGFGQSRQKFGWLPEGHTDFIYAIIAEELGFFGCILIIGLFWTLIQRGITIASRCPDRFGKLLAVGLTFSIGIQALLNMSVASSFLPATGVPLPFVSYGGTSVFTSMCMIGILLNISRKRIKKIKNYENQYSL